MVVIMFQGYESINLYKKPKDNLLCVQSSKEALSNLDP